MPLLSLALNDVDTSMPLLSEGKHVLAIAEVLIEDSKSSPGCLNLKVVFATIQPATDTTGKPIKPGYKITRYYPIPSELRDESKNDTFKKALCLLQLAVCGLANTESNRAQLPLFDEAFVASMPGKTVIGNIRTSKPKEGEDDSFGPKSEVIAVYPDL